LGTYKFYFQREKFKRNRVNPVFFLKDCDSDPFPCGWDPGTTDGEMIEDRFKIANGVAKDKA